MKYRIKIVIRKDGSSRYFPQYKGWFRWKHFQEYLGDMFWEDLEYGSEEEAIRFLKLKEERKIGAIVYKPIDFNEI